MNQCLPLSVSSGDTHEPLFASNRGLANHRRLVLSWPVLNKHVFQLHLYCTRLCAAQTSARRECTLLTPGFAPAAVSSKGTDPKLKKCLETWETTKVFEYGCFWKQQKVLESEKCLETGKTTQNTNLVVAVSRYSGFYIVKDITSQIFTCITLENVELTAYLCQFFLFCHVIFTLR